MTPTLMKRGGGVTNGFEICSRDLIFAKNIVIESTQISVTGFVAPRNDTKCHESWLMMMMAAMALEDHGSITD